jgi:hypothetical protein
VISIRQETDPTILAHHMELIASRLCEKDCRREAWRLMMVRHAWLKICESPDRSVPAMADAA